MEWDCSKRFVYAVQVEEFVTISKRLEDFLWSKRGRMSVYDWCFSYRGNISMMEFYLSMEEPDFECPRYYKKDFRSCDGCHEVKERCATWMRVYATDEEFRANKEGFVPF